jgi:chromosome condensin MukBEF MukE localization factor
MWLLLHFFKKKSNQQYKKRPAAASLLRHGRHFTSKNTHEHANQGDFNACYSP